MSTIGNSQAVLNNPSALNLLYYAKEPFGGRVCRLGMGALVGAGVATLPVVAAVVSQVAVIYLLGAGNTFLLCAYFCPSHTSAYRFTAQTFSTLSGALLTTAFLTHVVALSALPLCSIGIISFILASRFIESYKTGTTQKIVKDLILNKDVESRTFGWSLIKAGALPIEHLRALVKEIALSANAEVQKSALESLTSLANQGDVKTVGTITDIVLEMTENANKEVQEFAFDLINAIVDNL